jgi:hypothetical protein
MEGMARAVRDRRWSLLLLLGLMAGLATVGVADPGEAQEYAVKAAFLYNFAKFVEWPDEAKLAPTAPLSLCIVGPDPFGTALDTLQGKTVRGHPLEVEQLWDPTRPTPCHLAFISAAEYRPLDQVLALPALRSTLTVGDTPDFATQGGVIGLLMVDNKVRFEVNLRAARVKGLRISSQLLRLARTVHNAEAP